MHNTIERDLTLATVAEIAEAVSHVVQQTAALVDTASMRPICLLRSSGPS
jgi:hypothetical protein